MAYVDEDRFDALFHKPWRDLLATLRASDRRWVSRKQFRRWVVDAFKDTCEDHDNAEICIHNWWYFSGWRSLSPKHVWAGITGRVNVKHARNAVADHISVWDRGDEYWVEHG